MLERIGLSNSLAIWMVISSAAMVGLALALVPFVVSHIPADYFARPRRSAQWIPDRLRPVRWIVLILKNTIGAACLFFGALMLVLPGQGILTILLGIALLDFPGKFRLQRWVVRRPGVLDSLNWIRRKTEKPPLTMDSPDGESG